MKTRLIYSLLLLLGMGACGGRNDARNAAQQQYETVQEGSASGVTSTIHGPGETLPPITATDADTTTSFAFNPDALPLPSGYTPPSQPVTAPPIATVPPPMTSAAPAPLPPSRPVRPAPVPAPVPTETAATTETTATTATEEPPPPPAEEPSEPQEQDEAEPETPPPTTTTQEPPPPPPPA